MTQKLRAVLVAALVLFAMPFAGGVMAADTGNTTDDTSGNDTTEETTGNDATAGNDDGDAVFGIQVSGFVDSLKESNQTGPIGPLVADFVTSNNPGNAPDHAGPPSWLLGGNDSDNETDRRGPPEDVGPNGDDTRAGNETADNETTERGPPEDTGPDGDKDRGPPEDAGPNGDNERGPPEDAGPNGDNERGPP